ncbi:MAG: hypothetical protein JST89_11590 [Cyanobacteria bacterium SZAS-4]|nr:hypothetical protein [Cyanobacteria bacterium SZAS-4]
MTGSAPHMVLRLFLFSMLSSLLTTASVTRGLAQSSLPPQTSQPPQSSQPSQSPQSPVEISVDQTGSQPGTSEPAKSLDGKHFAYLDSSGLTSLRTPFSTIKFCSAADQNLDKFEQSFPCHIDTIRWLADGNSVVFLAQAHATSPLHLYQSNWRTRLTRDLTPFASRSVDRFWLSKNLKILIASIDLENVGKREKWVIDTVSGALSRVPENQRVDGTSVAPEDLLSWEAPCTRYYPIRSSSKTFAGQEPFLPLLQGNAAQRIVFVEPSASIDRELNAKTKTWTETERLQFAAVWKQVCERVPGLALRATHGQRLRVVREQGRQVPKNFLEVSSASASSGNGVLILYDTFFTSDGPTLVPMTIHELAHEADLYRHLSLSSEWINLIEPIVAASNNAFALSRKYGLKRLDDSGAKYFGLPSVYAANNCAESLAEWTVHYVNGTVPPPEIKNFIQNKVLNPNCEEEAVDQKVLSAFLDIEAEKFDLAESELRSLIKADPNFLKPYYFLTRLYIRANQIEKALQTSNELIKRMNSLHTSSVRNDDFAWNNYQHAHILADLHDYVNSQKYLSKALAVLPDEPTFLKSQRFLTQLKKKSGRKQPDRGSLRARGASTDLAHPPEKRRKP